MLLMCSKVLNCNKTACNVELMEEVSGHSKYPFTSVPLTGLNVLVPLHEINLSFCCVCVCVCVIVYTAKHIHCIRKSEFIRHTDWTD